MLIICGVINLKLKVVFIKRKHIYYIIFLLSLFILFIVFISSKKSVSTFNVFSKDIIIKNHDLNGDGINDPVYIKTNKGKYFVQVNCNKNSYILEPSKLVNTMGSYKNYWPLTLTLADVSRDKLCEIFIQTSQNDTAIQHMFIWDNHNFKDVLSNYNNIIGLVNSHNNETPKIISANYFNSRIDFSNYILVRNKLKNYNCDYPENFIGKDTIAELINYVQNIHVQTTKIPSDIFYPNTFDNSSALINKLTVDNNKYVFEDGSFSDTEYDKDGEISQVKWKLNFKAISNLDNQKIKNYSFQVFLKSSEDNSKPYSFKITSLCFN